MKDKRSVVRNPVEPKADPFMDEAMAMVYVGDVYSLVAQEGVSGPAETKPAEKKVEKKTKPQDDQDALWPYIR
jgi:hypothetical protein